ncbi:hypothetical protein GO730_39085 [Spirosoma sp. HMF3257]|nr:hypothetical protein [Spirosoma telluris]
MGSWDLRNFCNDLSIFTNLLTSKAVTGDFSQLSDLLIALNTKSIVEYKIENVAFYINTRIAGTIPDDLNYCQVFLDNMLMVRDPLDTNFDPLHAYTLDLTINVYKSKTSTKKAYCSSWHLDRHLKPGIPRYTHPMYHFQFGGKKLELIDPAMAVLPSLGFHIRQWIYFWLFTLYYPIFSTISNSLLSMNF